MFQYNFLYQNVLEATRGNNTLTTVFNNKANTIPNLEFGETSGNSDWNSIRFNIILNNTAKENKRNFPKFRKGDFEGISTRLSTEAWEDMISCQSTGQMGTGNHTGRVIGNGLALNACFPICWMFFSVSTWLMVVGGGWEKNLFIILTPTPLNT